MDDGPGLVQSVIAVPSVLGVLTCSNLLLILFYFIFTFSLVLNVRQFRCGLIYSHMCPLGCRLTRLRHGIFAHCAYFVCAMVKFSKLNKIQSHCFSDEFKNFLHTHISHMILIFLIA